jgi:hypothetical protein
VHIQKDVLFTDPSFSFVSEILVNGPPLILNIAPVEKGAPLQTFLSSPVNEHPAEFPSAALTVGDFCSQALFPYSGSPEKELSSRFP